MRRHLERRRELATAVWRTWGGRGLVRRAVYEANRRTGALRRSERRWRDATPESLPALRRIDLSPPASMSAADRPGRGAGPGIRLYGGLDLPVSIPPEWHTHPLTGRAFPAGAHWTHLSDASSDVGDIKDVWEMARFGWLHPVLRSWGAHGDDTDAEAIWRVLEDWRTHNPPYDGPHWMCGQETSLRAISTMVLADALDPSPRTTDERRRMVAGLVSDSVGRVAPTLGYALSQRNNHATSEAGFLWTAAILAPWLPGADRLARRAGRALSEAVADQFAADGSYAQHSPTYQRVALHVLLWCLAVSRSTGVPAPPGVSGAVARSVPHLLALMGPGSEGRVPNLGGNDGALVFDLAPSDIGDLRPVVAHAAAATGQSTGLGSGPWDEEAAWFGLERVPGPAPRRVPGRSTHALTRGTAHAVLRAGPLGHRPAHADQMHVDVWLGGAPVAVDPGSFRYTAPAPWGNALAGEEVHNLVRLPGVPQAVRSGRFFWRSWTEATVVEERDLGSATATLARIDLDDARIHRLVLVGDDLVVVVDAADGPQVEVRWNLLPADVRIEAGTGCTRVATGAWRARLAHEGTARTSTSDPDDPTSGWHAPTYAVLAPVASIVVGSRQPVVSAFGPASAGDRVDRAVELAAGIDLDHLDEGLLQRVASGRR